MTLLGYCQKFAGKDDEARATFTRAAAAMKPTPDSVVVVDARTLPCYLAWAYAGLGEKEKALEQARHAIADYDNDALAKPFAESCTGDRPGADWRYRFCDRRFAASARSAQWRNPRRSSNQSALGPATQRSALPETDYGGTALTCHNANESWLVNACRFCFTARRWKWTPSFMRSPGRPLRRESPRLASVTGEAGHAIGEWRIENHDLVTEEKALDEEDNDSARLLRYPPEHEIDPSRDRSFCLWAFSGTNGERGGTGGSRTHRIGRRRKGAVLHAERSSEPRRLARFPAQERAGSAGLFPIGGLVTLLPEAVGPTASQLEGTESDWRSGRGH